MTTEMTLTELAFAKGRTNADAQMLVAQMRAEVEKSTLTAQRLAVQAATALSSDAATAVALTRLLEDVPPPEAGLGVRVNKEV